MLERIKLGDVINECESGEFTWEYISLKLLHDFYWLISGGFMLGIINRLGSL